MSNSTSQEFALDYEALLNSITDGLLCLNDKYEVLYVNQPFEKLTGLSGSSLRGNNILQLYPQVKEHPEFEAFNKIFTTKQPYKITEFLPQIKKWLEVSAYYQDGNVVLLLK